MVVNDAEPDAEPKCESHVGEEQHWRAQRDEPLSPGRAPTRHVRCGGGQRIAEHDGASNRQKTKMAEARGCEGGPRAHQRRTRIS